MIITFLYIFSAAIALSLGLHNIFHDSKSRVNHIFFILTLTIFLWAFVYALMNISVDIVKATFFHRIGTIFYSIFYAIFLNFIIVITKNEKFFNKSKLLKYSLLYLPAIISLILYFFLYPPTAAEHFKTPVGWGHVYLGDKSFFVIHFHTLYYAFYAILALILIVKWYKTTNYKKEKMQAKFLFIGIISVLVIGAVTDTIFPQIGKYPLPPMGSIELIIPISLVWYSRKKYSMFIPHIDTNSIIFLKSTKIGIIIFDSNKKILEISEGALLLIQEREEIIKKNNIEIYFPYFTENSFSEINGLSTILKNSSGFKIPILLKVTNIVDEFKDEVGYILIFEDISQITNLQRQLKELNENLEKIVEQRTSQLQNEIEKQILEKKKYQTLFDNSHDAVAECDEKGIILNVNDRFELLFEYKREEIIGKHIDDVVLSEERKEEGLEITRKVLEKNIFALEGIRTTKNKKMIYTIIKGVPIVIDDKPVGGFAIYTDITKNKENEMKLRIMAQKDSLTDLYNLNQFEDYINSQELENKLPIGLIVSDINGLKFVNDSFGHDVGDKLLKSYAQVLLNSVRKDDLVFRTGGDEFLILIYNTNINLVEEVVKRIEINIEKYNEQSEDKTILVNSSIGHSIVYEKSLIKKELKKADDMMYRNKLLNKNSNKSTILKVLLSALSEKDYITMGHTDRVLKICKKIATKMNLDNDKKDNLFLLSEVHDIGKIAIPDSILRKPGRLNDEEWEIMKTHCEKGYRIAINSEELSSIAELVLKHHERWDGKGYPLGLKGDEIPIECRILSIADSFDAMISYRPYNVVKTKEKALEEIIACSSKQFDPEVVNAFNEIIDEIE